LSTPPSVAMIRLMASGFSEYPQLGGERTWQQH
jgi:hypothetical protein